ncbi:MAG: endo alpha-1,4 polygalactosaminidase [Planctomycetota bacterium]|jgi:uncharacterized protein (TIGR01370 family)|nr:endo alpha-1,4 polygalactosaminidase [Planctomycetota bacterium]
MGKFVVAGVVLAALFLAAGFAAHAGEAGRRRIDNTTKWLCYYGQDRRVLDVEGYDLLILESEAVGDLSPGDKKGRICVGYMSIGEVEQNRWYHPDVKDKPWVLDANPEWPDSRLVDQRSDEWRDLVVNYIAAGIVDAGYDGFILDNVDTAEELLRRDPELYKGADEGAAAIIRALRETYPDKTIIANGGLSVVPLARGSVDAVMYEGTFSSWKRLDGGGFGYGEIAPKNKTWQRPRLLRIKAAGLPVLALEYADPNDPAGVERVYEAVRKAGNNPYVSQRDLDTFPGSDALPPREEEED